MTDREEPADLREAVGCLCLTDGAGELAQAAEEVLCRPGAVTRLSDDVEVGVVGEPVSTASVTKELLADGAVPAPRLDCH